MLSCVGTMDMAVLVGTCKFFNKWMDLVLIFQTKKNLLFILKCIYISSFIVCYKFLIIFYDFKKSLFNNGKVTNKI